MRRSDREFTDTREILELIQKSDSCRLGMADFSGDEVQPYVVALNYAYEASPKEGSWGSFWFHGAKEGRKIDILRKNSRVCIQIDTSHELKTGPQACNWGMNYESLYAEGRAFIVEDEAEKTKGLNLLMQHFTNLYPEKAKILGNPENREFLYQPGMLKATCVIRVDLDFLSAKRRA